MLSTLLLYSSNKRDKIDHHTDLDAYLVLSSLSHVDANFIRGIFLASYPDHSYLRVTASLKHVFMTLTINWKNNSPTDLRQVWSENLDQQSLWIKIPAVKKTSPSVASRCLLYQVHTERCTRGIQHWACSLKRCACENHARTTFQRTGYPYE